MITRRALLGAALALPLGPHLGRAQGTATTPEALIAAARARAARAYQPPSRVLLPPFDALDYDGFRGVRPVQGRAADLPLSDQFRADLLPPGWLFPEPVQILLPGHDTRFSPSLFDIDPALVDLPDGPLDYGVMGFSGLRLRTPLNQPDIWDEVLVLQGASYFRALAEGTVYGLSARGLALGTGGPVPEEFPRIDELHVFDAQEAVHFGALIDSPRAAACLIGHLDPGAVTRMRLSLHLFPREVLADAGIAPLTSMFQHNALGPARIDDFRPAVHDSDVLVIENGAGELLWRPLSNPAELQMSAFADDGPRGFGLLQSPTDFADFKDAEGGYHRRPSAWVRPRGNWGRGAVMLLELPTMDEFADNIVAFWRPEAPLAPGAHQFDYDLDWLAPGLEALPVAHAAMMPRRMASGVEPNLKTGRLFVLDFAGSGGAAVDMAGAVADLSASDGVVLGGTALYPLGDRPGTWRLSFILTPQERMQAAELRIGLRDRQGGWLTPVLLYRWTRAAGGGL
ncbi:MAG: glucan biosynthesis protein [Roseinatronobacter sp.]